jgi:uncharacterized cupin superfamily protein
LPRKPRAARLATGDEVSDGERQGLTISAFSDMERAGSWLLVRRALDLASFGINAVDIAPGETIPEHDETDRDQEEVFLPLDGDLVLVVDGEDHALPQGSLARLDPELRRTARNDGERVVRLLIASAPRSSGYEAMDWA